MLQSKKDTVGKEDEKVVVTVEEKEKEKEVAVDQENQKIREEINHTYLICLIVYVLIMIIIFLIFTFSSSLREEMLRQMSKFEDKSVPHLLALFFIGIFIKITGLPITIYELTAAFILKNFLLSLALVSIVQIIGDSLAFMIGKLFLQKKLASYLSQYKEFIVLQKSSNKQPFKVSFLIRFMWLPNIVKSYGVSILNINFVQFIIPTSIQCILQSALFCYIGTRMRDISDVGSVSSDNNTYFEILLVFISLVLFYYLYVLCQQEYEQLQEEEAKDQQQKQQQISNQEEKLPLINNEVEDSLPPQEQIPIIEKESSEKKKIE